MKSLEKGKDKIEEISRSLKNEVLKPAMEEAELIIAEANRKAAEIVKDARKEAEQIHHSARKEIEQERNVFHASLEQAAAQVMETLRQDVEHKLFNSELDAVLKHAMSKPEVIADLIKAIVSAIEKEGLATEIAAVIPKTATAKEINALIGDKVLSKLKEQSVSVGAFTGGAQVKLLDKRMTIDITEDTLKEMVAGFVRKDFRKMIFAC
ncbi:MAG: V-type ATP synthase subunit E [Chlamydiales bacterium]|nr:V-type ATP synthase subunit E [Chlamydiia bacterium]MCP5506731.1 V-type ATP synthase subunit E [Chlamydiales bacterium]